MNSKQPIRSISDIVEYFHASAVARNELRIGLEVERSGVFNKDISPVQYSGPNGYLAIIKKLVLEVGWEIIDNDKDGNVKALKRGGSELHIEGDGRLELVSKPRKGLFSLCREYQMHTSEIDEISKEFGVRWVSTGWQPFARKGEIHFAFPREITSEYSHYRKHYSDWKESAFSEWDKKNNSIHVNFDYSSEKDAVNKFQTFVKISPILTAMFANSPLNAGKYSGYMINRPHSTFHVCPQKTRIQKLFFEEDFSFEKWVYYLLKLPMRRIERRGEQIYVPLSFGQYLENGYKNYTPVIRDFYLHIKSVWNEVRIKHYLEYRGFDTVPSHLLPSVPAIIRAIAINSEVMHECQNLVKDWTFTDHLEMREKVYKEALQAKTPSGGKMLDLAKELLNIASFSLQDNHKRRRGRFDATRYLRPIKEYIFVREQSPAEYVMEMWKSQWHKDSRKLIDWSEM